MEQSALGKKSLAVSETVVIAVLTAIAYAAFLLREIAFARHFGIPLDVIATREVGLALTAEALVFAFISYSAKVNLIWALTPKGSTFFQILIRRVIAIFLLGGFAMYPYLTTGLSMWWLIGPLALIIFLVFFFPLITQRNKLSYKEKFTAQAELEKDNSDIISNIIERLLPNHSITFFIGLAMMVFSYGIGRKDAIVQTDFFMVKDRPGWSVIKIYGEIIISAKIDLPSKKLAGEISIEKLGDGKTITLQTQKIGPIKSADKNEYFLLKL